MTDTLLRQWTVEDYHRMMDAGILGSDDRVELLDGQIIHMSPQYAPHAGITQWAAHYLTQMFQGKAYIRVQFPIALTPLSEPEPDIAVVRFDPKGYTQHHPQPKDIYLLLEVSDSTLKFDKTQKARIYAQAGIPEYWILDIPNRQVWVMQDPVEADYQAVSSLKLEAEISPVRFPEIRIPLAGLFPALD